MATIGLLDQDRIDRASNFCIYKARIEFMLDEHGLKEFMKTILFEPTYPIELHEYKKDMEK